MWQCIVDQKWLSKKLLYIKAIFACVCRETILVWPVKPVWLQLAVSGISDVHEWSVERVWLGSSAQTWQFTICTSNQYVLPGMFSTVYKFIFTSVKRTIMLLYDWQNHLLWLAESSWPVVSCLYYSVSNHTIFLVQFGINLHLWFLQKVEIASAEAARAILAFCKTHSCKLIPSWNRNRVIIYAYIII